MNVAFLHTSQFPFGGAEKVTSHVGSYLAQQGHRIHVFAYGSAEELLTESDRKYLTITRMGVARRNDRTFSEKLVEELNRHKIDLLILQSNHFVYGKEIVWLHKHTAAKIVYCHHSIPGWEVILRNEKISNKKAAGSTLQRFLWQYFGRHIRQLFKIDQCKFKIRYRRLFNHTDRYILLCEPYRASVAKIIGINPRNKKLDVITCSIPERKDFTLEKQKQLLYVGRLTIKQDKAVDRLLKIWDALHREFSDWELLLVGDGDDRDALMMMSQEMGLERIRFCGHAVDTYNYFNDASILCLTSTFEGCPLVLCEAQQAGVVPIAFNCSAGIECVLGPDGVNGILIPPFEMETYVRRLSEMMRNPKMREDMQQNLFAKASDYKMECVGPRWDALLEELHVEN